MQPELEVLIGDKKVSAKRLEAASVELERIRAKYGTLSAQIVLRETEERGRKSPIFWAFNWSDSAAARKFRLGQAGHLIREVKVRIVHNEQAPRTIRAYTYIREPGGGSYLPTLDVLTEPQLRQQALQQLLLEIDSLKRKYSDLSWVVEHLDVFSRRVKRRVKKAA